MDPLVLIILLLCCAIIGLAVGYGLAVQRYRMRVSALSGRRHAATEDPIRQIEIYGKAFADSPIYITVSTLDEGRILDANQAFLEALGKRREEVIGRTAEDLRLWANPRQRDEIVRRLKNGEQLRNVEILGGAVGSIGTWLLYSAELIQVENRPCLLSLCSDISPRKRAEQALEESEARYRLLVENMSEGLWLIDENANTTFVNARMAEMLGYEPDEMVGQHLFKFMDTEGRRSARAYLDQRRRGVREQHDFELLRKDGSRVHVFMETAPILDDDGHYHGAIAGVMDITQRRRAEEAIERQAARLGILNEVVARANEAESVEKLTRHALQLMLDLLGMKQGGFYEVDAGAGVVRLKQQLGLTQEFQRHFETLSLDRPSFRATLRDREVLAVSDTRKWDAELAEQSNVVSFVAVPVLQEGKAVGTINAFTEERREFDEAERSILRSIGDQVGTALARIRTAEMRKRYDALLNAAMNASQYILRSDDYERALPTALKMLGDTPGLDRIHVVESRRSEDGSETVVRRAFWCRAECALPEDNDEAAFSEYGNMIRAWGDTLAAKDNRMRPVFGLTREMPPPIHDAMSRRGIHSILLTPILIQGRFWGVMSVADCHSERRWTEAEQAILQTFAAGIGSAVVRNEAEQQRVGYGAQLEQKNRELADQNIRNELILRGIGDGVIVIDLNRRIVLVNDVARQMLGLRREQEEAGEQLQDLLRRCAIADDATQVMLEGPGSQRTELVVPEGGGRTLDVMSAAYLDEKGRPAGRVFVLRDMTRDREIERMKSRFVSSVSHELRTPLTSIKGFTKTLLRDTGMPAGTRDTFLRIIQEETDRLTALIDDILDISRIESGQLTLKSQRIDLAEIIKRNVRMFQPTVRQKRQRISVELAPDLPRPLNDADSVQTILNNLLSNAVKFTPAGGDIRVRAYPEENGVAIEVSDTGLGIGKRELDRIFDRFYRIEREGAEAPGTGLGLSIVQDLLTMMGGKVRVDSEVSKGSTFTVILPEEPDKAASISALPATDRTTMPPQEPT